MPKLVLTTVCILLLLGAAFGQDSPDKDKGPLSWKVQCRELLEKMEALEKDGRLSEALDVISGTVIDDLVEAKNRISLALRARELKACMKIQEEVKRLEVEGRIEEALSLLKELLQSMTTPEARRLLGNRMKGLRAKVVGERKFRIHTREGAEPIDLTKDKLFVLPPEQYGFASYAGVDQRRLVDCLDEGILSRSSSLLTVRPLKPAFEAVGIGGVARRLCYGAYHSIEVRLDDRHGEPGKDYKVHARRGYYSTAARNR